MTELKRITLLLILLSVFSLNTLNAQNLIKTGFAEKAALLNSEDVKAEIIPLWKTKVGPYILQAASQVRINKALAFSNAPKQPTIQMSQKNGEFRAKVFIGLLPGTDPYSLAGFEPILVLPSGKIATGWLSLNSLKSIASNDGVIKIEASKFSYPTNGEANILSKVDQVHAGTGGLSQAYTGKGVVIGVIDSGIDFTAADFSDENGTRILYLVDLLEDDTEVVYTKAQIDANPEAVAQRDGVGGGGHGTHVTGTAAGNGAGDDRFKGVAPEADIIFIKGIRALDSDGGFGDADVIDGINFIFEKAAEMNKPAVVNLSLGGNSGPLDGSSLIEQSMTELQEGPGKIIAAAAGNEGFDFLHTGAEVSTGTNYVTIEYGKDAASISKEIWYDPGVLTHFSVAAFEVSDDGELNMVASMSDFVPVGNENNDTPITLTKTGTEIAIAQIVYDGTNTQDANNGDGQLYIDINQNDESVALDDYYWGIFYRTGSGTGRFDGISRNAGAAIEELGFEGFTYIPGTRDRSVGSPATAKDIISVGAYVSTNSWTADNGETFGSQHGTDPYYTDVYTPEIGEIAEFSSRGPTRDGRLAPIISAPGDQIFSVRSSHISDSDLDPSKMVNGGKYMGMQGTSMATPHVTGIIALMLEANPLLTYEQIVAIFRSTSVPDSFTSTLPNTIFGVGKVDALASVLAAAETTTSIDQDLTNLPTTFSLEQNYPNPFNPTTTISFTLPISTQVELTIYDMLGQKIQVLEQGVLSAGAYNRSFNASSLPTGIYFYRLQAAGFSQVQKMTLLK